MFTSIDKALAALLMGVVAILDQLFGIDIGLGEDTVTAIAAALTPILVWLVPNKPAA
jgi:hypothetical protein